MIVYDLPCNDPEYSKQRLNEILSRPRLIFNPYRYSDKRLMEIVESTGWGDTVDMVEMVTIKFLRVRETDDWRKFDGVMVQIGNNPEEVHISTAALSQGTSARDTRKRERSWIGKKQIYRQAHVAELVGKRVFVSRLIRGTTPRGIFSVAYKMYKLTGNLHRDARVIREAMCDAKVEMLERILAYPDCDYYLSCDKNFIDYEPRIRRAIRIINEWRTLPVPED